MPYGNHLQVASTPLASSSTLHTDVEDKRTTHPPFTPLASSDTLIHQDEPHQSQTSDPEKCQDIEALKSGIKADVSATSDISYTPPDGGFKAWSTVLGASLVAFTTFGYAYYSV